MKHSFLATIAFSLMLVLLAFLANAVGLFATGAKECAFGILWSVIAAAFCWGAQHNFTRSAMWQEHHERSLDPMFAGPSHPDAYAKLRRYHFCGLVGQLGAGLFLVVSQIYFISAFL